MHNSKLKTRRELRDPNTGSCYEEKDLYSPKDVHMTLFSKTVVWRSSYQKTDRRIKYEGKLPNLTLLFYDKIYGLPCVAEKGKPPPMF
jgi:hypothetical protein